MRLSPLATFLPLFAFLSFLSSLPLSPLRAQTFVVDAAGGPGSQFTSIQTAVTTVPDGAVLLVRAGNYAPFTIVAKGLTVIGEPGAKVVDTFVAHVTVTNTTAQQRVVVRDLAIENFSTGDIHVELSSCAGAVFLQNVTIPVFGPGVAHELIVQNCAQVLVDACGPFTASNFFMATTLVNSDVVFVGCNLHASGGQAAWASGGTVHFVVCSVMGGASAPAGTAAAVQLLNTELWLTGGGAVVATAGISGLPPAIGGTGVVRHDPAVTIVGACQPALTAAALPSVAGVDGSIGTTASAVMRGPAGHLGVLVLGEAGAPLAVPGFLGDVWLDPTTAVVAAAGVFGPDLTASVPVPFDPALHGAVFGWQAVTIDASGAFTVGNAHWFAP